MMNRKVKKEDLGDESGQSVWPPGPVWVALWTLGRGKRNMEILGV